MWLFLVASFFIFLLLYWLWSSCSFAKNKSKSSPFDYFLTIFFTISYVFSYSYFSSTTDILSSHYEKQYLYSLICYANYPLSLYAFYSGFLSYIATLFCKFSKKLWEICRGLHEYISLLKFFIPILFILLIL